MCALKVILDSNKIMTETFTDTVRDFIEYISSRIDILDISGGKPRLHQELDVIQKLFDKYNDEQLEKLFKTMITESDLRSLRSFNSSLIGSTTFVIPVKSDKKPKLRVGYFYRKFEELAESVDHDQIHIEYMIKLLEIVGSVFDMSTTIDIYDRMRGNVPQASNLTGILESIPGINTAINSFLSPELISTLKEKLENSKDKDMNPEMIKDMVEEILEKTPQLESQKPLIKGILENILRNPAALSEFGTNPAAAITSLLGGGDIMSMIPLLTGGGSVETPSMTNEQMGELMNFNPYAQ